MSANLHLLGEISLHQKRRLKELMTRLMLCESLTFAAGNRFRSNQIRSLKHLLKLLIVLIEIYNKVETLVSLTRMTDFHKLIFSTFKYITFKYDISFGANRHICKDEKDNPHRMSRFPDTGAVESRMLVRGIMVIFSFST